AENPTAPEPWAVTIVRYAYSLEVEGESELLAYHLDPMSAVKYPHLHIGSAAGLSHRGLGNAHPPTGLVLLGGGLRRAITQLGARRPRRADWEVILASTHSP